MKKMLLLIFAVITLSANAQLIQFQWEEYNPISLGYSPGVTVSIGESHRLAYSANPNTPDLFADPFNWVYYELIDNVWAIVDTPSIFSISPDGVITGLKTGFAAIKPTAYIQGGNERCYIEVTEAREAEPNNDSMYATALSSYPVLFNLYSENDEDWFSVYANQGDEITFKISSPYPLWQTAMFKIDTYDSDLQCWNVFNRTLSETESEFEVPLVAHYTTGLHYIRIYFNAPQFFFYSGDLKIQAYINGNPISGVHNLHYDGTSTQPIRYYDLQGNQVDPDAKGQVIIKTENGKASKYINR